MGPRVAGGGPGPGSAPPPEERDHGRDPRPQVCGTRRGREDPGGGGPPRPDQGPRDPGGRTTAELAGRDAAAPEPPPRERAEGRDRGGQHRGPPVGTCRGPAVRTQGARGARGGPGGRGLRAGTEGRRRGLRVPPWGPRPPGHGPASVRCRLPREAGVHAGAAALRSAAVRVRGHGRPNGLPGRDVQGGRRGPLPDRDERAPSRSDVHGRDPRRGPAAGAAVRGRDPVPEGDRGPRGRHEGPVPDAPVRQGRAVRVLPSGGGWGGPRGTPEELRGLLPRAPDPVPRRHPVLRGHGQGRREDVRPRGVVPPPERLPGGRLELQLHGLPGPPAEHPRGEDRGGEGPRPHPEQHPRRHEPVHGRDPRELPASGRHGRRPEGAEAVHGRGLPHRGGGATQTEAEGSRAAASFDSDPPAAVSGSFDRIATAPPERDSLRGEHRASAPVRRGYPRRSPSAPGDVQALERPVAHRPVPRPRDRADEGVPAVRRRAPDLPRFLRREPPGPAIRRAANSPAAPSGPRFPAVPLPSAGPRLTRGIPADSPATFIPPTPLVQAWRRRLSSKGCGSGLARPWPWTESISASPRAKSSASSGRTGRGRRPPSGACAASSGWTGGRRGSAGTTSSRTRSLPAAHWRSSPRCRAPSRS